MQLTPLRCPDLSFSTMLATCYGSNRAQRHSMSVIEYTHSQNTPP
jgi:hypothetical protein